MRIKKTVDSIDYEKTSSFFKKRAEKYKNDNPYSVTMYQDNNPELVKKRNSEETQKIIPKLQLEDTSRILDVACGVGRWSDAINIEIEEYCGIDFCDGLIQIAKERNSDLKNRFFFVGDIKNVTEVIDNNHNNSKYNRVLLIGALMYLNDSDLVSALESVEKLCEANTIICIREPVGIGERLTLKEELSEELCDEYNAIYRTRDELVTFFEESLLKKGFTIQEEGFLFEDAKLNNRKETAQYYFILGRTS